jgi:hypothetical protein
VESDQHSAHPPRKIDTAYHRAEAAIQKLADLAAAWRATAAIVSKIEC